MKLRPLLLLLAFLLRSDVPPLKSGANFVVDANGAYLATLSADTLLADSFTGANATALSGRALVTGGNWVQQSGVWTINTNRAVQASAGAAYYILTADAGRADVQLRTTLRVAGASGSAFGGLIFRFTDLNNFWMVGLQPLAAGPEIRLRKFVAGVMTDVVVKTPWAARYQKGVAVEVTLDGDDISVLVDGGYGFTATDSFNHSATLHGIGEYRDGTYQANGFDDFQVAPVPTFPWTRQGTVLSAGAGDSDNVFEPTVIREGNAQILTGTVFKMWYSSGWFTTQTNYAESKDGRNWTKYSGNPVLAGARRSTVLHDGSTYYMFADPAANQLNLYTSPDGLVWTLDTAAVIAPGAAGAWDDTYVANSFVWKEGPSDWRMLYDGNGTGARSGGIWATGYATSPDGRTWTKDVNNPVLGPQNGSGPGGVIGGTTLVKSGSFYYLYAIVSPPAGLLPTYIMRFRSADLINWAPFPMLSAAPRVGSAEGADGYLGQTADPALLVVGNVVYLYFAASSDGSVQAGQQHIVLQTANINALVRH